MNYMFNGASSYNSRIMIQTDSVAQMNGVFLGATSFNHDRMETGYSPSGRDFANIFTPSSYLPKKTTKAYY